MARTTTKKRVQPTMSREELREEIKEEVKDAVQTAVGAVVEDSMEKMLIVMGFNPKKPLEVQEFIHSLKDFVKLYDNPEFREDMQHLRKWRRLNQSLFGQLIAIVMGGIVAGICTYIWLGIKTQLNSASN